MPGWRSLQPAHRYRSDIRTTALTAEQHEDTSRRIRADVAGELTYRIPVSRREIQLDHAMIVFATTNDEWSRVAETARQGSARCRVSLRARRFASTPPSSTSTSKVQRVLQIRSDVRPRHARSEGAIGSVIGSSRLTGVRERRDCGTRGLASPPVLAGWFRTPCGEDRRELHGLPAHDRLRPAYGRAAEILQQARSKRIGARAGLQVEYRLPTTALEDQRVMIR
jgi:hypothetical protein